MSHLAIYLYSSLLSLIAHVLIRILGFIEDKMEARKSPNNANKQEFTRSFVLTTPSGPVAINLGHKILNTALKCFNVFLSVTILFDS